MIQIREKFKNVILVARHSVQIFKLITQACSLVIHFSTFLSSHANVDFRRYVFKRDCEIDIRHNSRFWKATQTTHLKMKLILATTLVGLASAGRKSHGGREYGRDHEAGFNSWCSDSWAQKRSCAQATQAIRQAAGLIREATVLNETTGQYTVDVAAALAGTGVLATDLDGAVLYDGQGTGFNNVPAEDDEFWQSIKRGGFNYMPTNSAIGQAEVLSLSSHVMVRPLLDGDDELEDIPPAVEGLPQFTNPFQRRSARFPSRRRGRAGRNRNAQGSDDDSDSVSDGVSDSDSDNDSADVVTQPQATVAKTRYARRRVKAGRYRSAHESSNDSDSVSDNESDSNSDNDNDNDSADVVVDVGDPQPQSGSTKIYRRSAQNSSRRGKGGGRKPVGSGSDHDSDGEDDVVQYLLSIPVPIMDNGAS